LSDAVGLDHLTRYGYDEEVKFSTQYLRLTPRSTGRQTITAMQHITPAVGRGHRRAVRQGQRPGGDRLPSGAARGKFSTQYLRLTPRSTGRQTITAWTLTLPDGAAVTNDR
jgi:transglutaminase-like putative cysteine protease